MFFVCVRFAHLYTASVAGSSFVAVWCQKHVDRNRVFVTLNVDGCLTSFKLACRHSCSSWRTTELFKLTAVFLIAVCQHGFSADNFHPHEFLEYPYLVSRMLLADNFHN